MSHSHSTGRICSQVFHEGNPLAENRTRIAAWLTAVMMVAEIIGGWWYNSMAVLADGWHMSSHALALGLAVFAYRAARRYAHDPRFAFGTWKIEVLAGYTSALGLVGVAGLMLYESVERLVSPRPIHYDEALILAIVGLLVNLACAWLLKDDHHHHGEDHHHDHPHAHDHAHDHHHDHGHDLNLRSAYIHVLADAATSVLAIAALLAGKWWGLSWLDPVMGLAGAVLVGVWAVGLLRETGKVLLDADMTAPVVGEIHEVIADSPVPATITDLHVWRVGKGKFACIVALETGGAATADFFRQQLAIHEELVHITVELNLPQA